MMLTHKPLAAVAAVGLIIAALQLAASKADALPDVRDPIGTKASGNTYVLYWIKPDPALTVRSVKIGGKWASLSVGGYWEAAMFGDKRNMLTRKVEVHAKQGVQKTYVLFEEVADW